MSGAALTSIEQSLQSKLMKALSPVHFELVNESSSHHRDPEGESHFKLLVVTTAFEGLSRVARQQLVQNLLDEERSRGLHTLSLKTLTPSEWEKAQAQNQTFVSPTCLGKSET